MTTVLQNTGLAYGVHSFHLLLQKKKKKNTPEDNEFPLYTLLYVLRFFSEF